MNVSAVPARHRFTRPDPLKFHAPSGGFLALALSAPGLLLLAAFVGLPAVETLINSLFRWDGLSPDRQFVGIGMFAQSINEPGFVFAIRNSLICGLIGMLVPTSIGLAAAALIEQSRIRPKALFRFALFVPYFFSMAVGAAIFARVYDPSYGLLNKALAILGTGLQPQWLGDASLALPAAIAVYVWHETPFAYIVFTAAIQQLDREQMDAALVDGASSWQRFLHITVPNLHHVITFVMLVLLIGGLTPFAVVYALTTPGLGGPNYATEVLPTMVFKKGLQGFDAGEAAAMGVILLIVVVTMAFLLLWVRRRTDPFRSVR